jgi:hypothetical protein
MTQEASPCSIHMSYRFSFICNCEDDSKDATPCEICDEFAELKNLGTETESWCFEWIKQLKDYATCLETEKAESDRQVRLMVNHTDDSVIDVRYKLAILQTQTVRSKVNLNLKG